MASVDDSTKAFTQYEGAPLRPQNKTWLEVEQLAAQAAYVAVEIAKESAMTQVPENTQEKTGPQGVPEKVSRESDAERALRNLCDALCQAGKADAAVNWLMNMLAMEVEHGVNGARAILHEKVEKAETLAEFLHDASLSMTMFHVALKDCGRSVG